MQILNSQEVHFQPRDFRFGPSKIKAVIVFLIVNGLLVFPLVLTFQNRQWVPFAIILFIGGIGFFGVASWVVKAFKKDGWKLAVQNSAILLKAGITGKDSRDVLEIRFCEIASVRKICERYIRYKGGENPTKPVRFDALEMELTPDVFARLENLLEAGATGLDIAAPYRLIYPTGTFMLSTNKIISQLEPYCRVQEAQVVCYDLPALKDKKNVDSYILFLDRRGHGMDAMALAEDAFKMGVNEAGKYVSNLMKKPPPEQRM